MVKNSLWKCFHQTYDLWWKRQIMKIILIEIVMVRITNYCHQNYDQCWRFWIMKLSSSKLKWWTKCKSLEIEQKGASHYWFDPIMKIWKAQWTKAEEDRGGHKWHCSSKRGQICHLAQFYLSFSWQSKRKGFLKYKVD